MRRAADRAGRRRRARPSLEEEADEIGVLRELLDLLLHERHRRTHASRAASRCPARRSHLAEPVGVLVRLQVAQVDAVQPVELLVVERRRARHDALERESLDELVPRHDRRLVVVAPAEQREEVDQRRREVAGVAEVVERHGVPPLRQLAPVVAVDVRNVRVDGQVGAERAQDVDLRRRVRDVVLAADHVCDLVEHVVDRRDEVVGRPAVRADDHEVGEQLVPELDLAADGVVPGDRPLLRLAEPDRALVLVRLALRDELLARAARALSAVSSWKLTSPSQSIPSQISDSLICAVASATSRLVSVFSIRSRISPPAAARTAS